MMGLLPMDADILPAYDDRIFKLILTSPGAELVLMDLISSIVGWPVTGVVVHNNELPVGDVSEKAESFDVNCSSDDGSQFNVEMQASHVKEDSDGEHRNLKGKSVYYVTDLHSSQPSKGVRRYDRLARTYQVTFCAYTVFPGKKAYMNSFSMRNDVTYELLTDALRVIFVELSKLEDVITKSVSDMTDLEKWAVFFQYANDPKYREALNRVLNSKEALQMAGSLLMNVSKDERERAVFRSRRKYQSDLESNMATAEDIGRLKGRVEIARNLLEMNLPLDQIAAATGLSREKIESLYNIDISQGEHLAYER